MQRFHVKYLSHHRWMKLQVLPDYICPDSHYFESWNDANPYTGSYSLAQPAIAPLFCKPRHEGTRSAQETLLKWAGSEVTDYYTYIQNYWKKNLLPELSDEGGGYLFTTLWNTTSAIRCA